MYIILRPFLNSLALYLSVCVEGQDDVAGRSDGELKSLDLAENLFVGNVPSKQKRIFENIGVRQGLVGCIHRLRVGTKEIDLHFPGSKDILKLSDVHDCVDNPCSQWRPQPCKLRAAGQIENHFELVFRTQTQAGLLLWANKGSTVKYDYLALALSDGYLGTQQNNKNKSLNSCRAQC